MFERQQNIRSNFLTAHVNNGDAVSALQTLQIVFRRRLRPEFMDALSQVVHLVARLNDPLLTKQLLLTLEALRVPFISGEETSIVLALADQQRSQLDEETLQALDSLLSMAASHMVGLPLAALRSGSQGVLVQQLEDLRGPVTDQSTLAPNGFVTAQSVRYSADLDGSHANVTYRRDFPMPAVNDPWLPVGQPLPPSHAAADSESPTEKFEIHEEQYFVVDNLRSLHSLSRHTNWPCRIVEIGRGCQCPNCGAVLSDERQGGEVAAYGPKKLFTLAWMKRTKDREKLKVIRRVVMGRVA